MGDDLSLPEREALRTPMQWDGTDGAGFSGSDEPVRPVISTGEYGAPNVNVAKARQEPDSLLMWFERMIASVRECPEIGTGTCHPVQVASPAVLAHRFEAPGGTLLLLHNLGRDEVSVDLGPQPGQDGDPVEVFADRRYDPPTAELSGLTLTGSGFRWLRLRRTV